MFSRFLHIESCAQCVPCKRHSDHITDLLEDIDRGNGSEGHVEEILRRCRLVTDGQRCYIPTAASVLVQSVVRVFVGEIAAHLEGPCPLPRETLLPKLVDFDGATGQFGYDRRYARKRPDWTYDEAIG